MEKHLSLPLSAGDVVRRHEGCLALAGWPEQPWSPEDPDPLWWWIQRNHDCNARLWAEEDLARRTQVPAQDIADNKRAIDRFNQARNDAVERVDELLLMRLGLLRAVGTDEFEPSVGVPGARLNSETAGSIIDRLSILALKIRAMDGQARRTDVDEDHLASCRAKLWRLHRQREDLAGCLDTLLADTRAGRACFRLYRQFKMYNDAGLNPALVAEQAPRPFGALDGALDGPPDGALEGALQRPTGVDR